MPGVVTQGTWWTQTGWRQANCTHDAFVHAVDGRADTSSADILPSGRIFIPAPVDLHIHGGGGYDCMAGEGAIRGLLSSAATSGTGALLATSVTAPADDISAFLDTVKCIMAAPDNGSACLLGAHLEGPFINPGKLGAQPPYPLDIDTALLARWFASGVVRAITFAPELDASAELIELCQQHHVRAQIGHTLCDWQTAKTALQSGCGITHMYNAMSGIQARAGGAAAAALGFADYAEIITDGIHVDAAAFHAARRAIPNLYSVTDATAATGMPDGAYQLGNLEVMKSGDSVRLADGTLAGSCLTQLRSVAVLRSWGMSWHAIGQFSSAIPARWIGARQCGNIAPGTRASWLEIQDDAVVAVWIDGQRSVID